jgi:hypothetical protein
VDDFRAMLFLNEDIGELAVVAGEEAILMERVGVAAMVVLRLDTGVGLPLEVMLNRTRSAIRGRAEVFSCRR